MPRDVSARRLGRLSAEERARLLFDDGRHESLSAHGIGAATAAFEREGFVATRGRVDGREVYVLANDRRFARGTYDALNCEVMVCALRLARERGVPVVFLFDSDGVRVDGGYGAVVATAGLLREVAETSGHVPLLAGIFGVASGAAAYAAALCDLVFAVDRRSFAFVAGPAVVAAAIGQEVGLDALGGTPLHEAVSGFVHGTARDDGELVAKLRAGLSYLPSSAAEVPARTDARAPDAHTQVSAILPADRRRAYDVTKLIACVVDGASHFPIGSRFGPSVQVGFAHIEGHKVALIASQPRAHAGAIDADASQKVARFVRLAAAYNLPIVTLCDTPGFVPGARSERARILVHGAKVISAYADAARTVPLVAVVVRRAAGAGSVLMFGADTILALPGYELSAMGDKAERALSDHLGLGDNGSSQPRATAAPRAIRVVEPERLRAELALWLASARAPVCAARGDRKLTLCPL